MRRGVAPRPKSPSPPSPPSVPKPGSSPEQDLLRLLINELYIKMCPKCPMAKVNGGLCPSSDEDIIKCMADVIAEHFRPVVEVVE